MNELIPLMVSLAFFVFSITLILVWNVERRNWAAERTLLLNEWKKEREGLYERIHAGSYNEFKHAEIMKIKAEKPKEPTTWEEV